MSEQLKLAQDLSAFFKLVDLLSDKKQLQAIEAALRASAESAAADKAEAIKAREEAKALGRENYTERTKLDADKAEVAKLAEQISAIKAQVDAQAKEVEAAKTQATLRLADAAKREFDLDAREKALAAKESAVVTKEAAALAAYDEAKAMAAEYAAKLEELKAIVK